MRNIKTRQTGISIVGLIIILALFAMVALVVAKVVPTYSEYRAIQGTVVKASKEGSINEIRAAYNRAVPIDDITSLDSKDLEITKVDGGFLVTYAYSKKIPLVGPVSLVIDYSGSSKGL